LLLGLAGIAHASPITSNGLTGASVIDFSQFVASPVTNAVGPIQVGALVGEDVTLSGTPNTGLYAYNAGWGFLSNGNWDTAMHGFVGGNSARPGSIIFAFNSVPVSGVGAFMNHCPDPACGSVVDLVISAYDSNHVLLETYDVTQNSPIVTPNATDAGGFRGFSRASADISFFVVSGSVPAVDNLNFVRDTAAVPEPVSLVLLGTGVAGLAARRRAAQRRRR
jgi:PEP-CTERM motif